MGEWENGNKDGDKWLMVGRFGIITALIFF